MSSDARRTPREIGDVRYAAYDASDAFRDDDWLERRSTPFRDRARRVLDVGCGIGLDVRKMVAWGHEVTAVDLSAEAVAQSRQRVPAARHFVIDTCDIPVASAPNFDAVIASLSLHYFGEQDTREIVRRLMTQLASGAKYRHDGYAARDPFARRQEFVSPKAPSP